MVLIEEMIRNNSIIINLPCVSVHWNGQYIMRESIDRPPRTTAVHVYKFTVNSRILTFLYVHSYFNDTFVDPRKSEATNQPCCPVYNGWSPRNRWMSAGHVRRPCLTPCPALPVNSRHPGRADDILWPHHIGVNKSPVAPKRRPCLAFPVGGAGFPVGSSTASMKWGTRIFLWTGRTAHLQATAFCYPLD